MVYEVVAVIDHSFATPGRAVKWFKTQIKPESHKANPPPQLGLLGIARKLS
jgi:hypothetical protein